VLARGVILLAKVFVDFYIERCDDTLLETARKLGYYALACSNRFISGVKEVSVKTFNKVIVPANYVGELRNALRDINHKNNIVTVHPMSVEVARWASHDGRIDSILMTPENIKVFDKKQASTMKYYSKPLEVRIPDLVHGDSEIRGAIYRRLNLFAKSGVPVIAGTMAREWFELISPVAIIKLLSTQYDIPEKVALRYLTDIPQQVISSKWGNL